MQKVIEVLRLEIKNAKTELAWLEEKYDQSENYPAGQLATAQNIYKVTVQLVLLEKLLLKIQTLEGGN